MRIETGLCIAALILMIVPNGSAQDLAAESPQLITSNSPFGTLGSGLSSLPYVTSGQTHSISAENPSGGKGLATIQPLLPGDPYHLSSDAAAGWKKHPFLAPKAHETVTLMDVDGPAVIQHIWMVPDDAGFLYHGRGCILRFYWDGETSPSVEAPVTDFFAIGHDTFAPVNSLAVVDNPSSALNSFWPMPFRKHARITFTNDSDRDEGLLAYQITYTEGPIPSNIGYFHAQYRQGSWAALNPYVILDGVRGKGRYVGTLLEISQTDDIWFGEGEVQFYIDGDTDLPTISGTGTEDYFLFSYGFPQVRSTLYSGVTLKDGVKEGDAGGTAGAKWTMYRWHIMDPIGFQSDFRITIQGLGGLKNQLQRGFVKRHDLLSSVAYWYQMEPHAPFPPVPLLADRTRDPFADLPLSIFDLRQAAVTNGQEPLTWQDCRNSDTDFRKLFSGYQSTKGAFICYGAAAGVTTGIARQERGFLMHPDRIDAAVSATWTVSAPQVSNVHLQFGLVPTSNATTRFSVQAHATDGSTVMLLDDTLRPPEAAQDVTLRMPNGVDSLRFTTALAAGGTSSTLWFRPELR